MPAPPRSRGPISWATTPSDLGRLLVAHTGIGCCAVRLADSDDELAAWVDRAFPDCAAARDDAGCAALVVAVHAHLDGDPYAPPVTLDLRGTDFQLRVWRALTEIPLGEVRTYGEVAVAVGAPRAVRAVGTACGANPTPILVPCHRVVPRSGGLGQFALGPERKQALLEREGVVIRRAP
ncbi:MAG: methylated-DNA--[protein]-cysteine S-methyltransferase [Actinomycetes bacterium]